jgi:hypothetical protein
MIGAAMPFYAFLKSDGEKRVITEARPKKSLAALAIAIAMRFA